MNPLNPEPPFVWPEPRVITQMCAYTYQPPYASLAQEAKVIFGITSAVTKRGIAVLESWLESNRDLKISLIVAVYPACATKQADLVSLARVAQNNSERVTIHIYPLEQVTDRAANVLFFFNRLADTAHVVTGPTEDLGLAPRQEGQVNLVFRADALMIEAFRRYFDWLWAYSRDVTAEGTVRIPNLVLPVGTEAGARLWREYYDHCLGGTIITETQSMSVNVDPKDGVVTIVSFDGRKIPSPTDASGLAKLNALAERTARLYEKGYLVSVDKLSRIPPLDAPLDPRLFGDAPKLEKGEITRKVSMRISVIDANTFREIEKRRRGIQVLLDKLTFGLADNMRWMPIAAREMFEAELKRVNEAGKSLISDLVRGDIDEYIEDRRAKLASDINAMYRTLGGRGEVANHVIDEVAHTLKQRLNKAGTADFVPKLSYSRIVFTGAENNFASPWGQAYSLLSDIASFPRKVLTDYFFLRGIEIPQADLIEVMNVADDAICRDLQAYNVQERCKAELDLLTAIKNAFIDSRDRCELVWRIIDGDPHNEVTKALEALKEREKPS